MIALPLDKQLLYRQNGYTFGYPSCCIEHFIKKATYDYWYDDLDYTNPFKDTGFIACKSCATKVAHLSKFEASYLLLGRDIFTSPKRLTTIPNGSRTK